MNAPSIDADRIWDDLLALLQIPSPTGYTDHIVHHVVERLESLDVPVEVTRRGAIRARVPGRKSSPARAIVTHLDTIGAIVTGLKDNGRLALAPIGTWSSRFAEGARVTIFKDEGQARGTILPLKASGHVFGDEVDTQPCTWNQVELRVDAPLHDRADLEKGGFHVGDFVAVDPAPEVTEDGYVISRHLDDKAGVAAVLEGARAALALGTPLEVECRLLFTITEEVGSGASSVLHGDVAEMVAIDNATVAPGQESIEDGVTIAIADSSGPFDYHLTRRLIELCGEGSIRHARDVFRYYRCDAAAAVEAGNDLRTALLGIGLDASHGIERTHIDSMRATAELVARYMHAGPLFSRDRKPLAPLGDFPEQPFSPPPGEAVVPDTMPDGQS